MRKQVRVFFIICLSVCLSSCLGSIWTGASLVYDRHDVYKKLNDYHILVDVTKVLYVDKTFKCDGCVLDIAVFNGDILIAGHLPTAQLQDKVRNRLSFVTGYRRIFNEVVRSNVPLNTVQDGWITTKIRSQIFADDSIDPNAFKVLTSDKVVYLMGDVRQAEAERVIRIARQTNGVARVVKILKYFTYQSK